MSWSRSYSGTPKEVIAAAKADRESIEAPLPDFERADVAHVIRGAEAAVQAVPHGASVTLTISGSGYRDTTGAGGGSQGVSISYSLPAMAPAQAYPPSR